MFDDDKPAYPLIAIPGPWAQGTLTQVLTAWNEDAERSLLYNEALEEELNDQHSIVPKTAGMLWWKRPLTDDERRVIAVSMMDGAAGMVVRFRMHLRMQNRLDKIRQLRTLSESIASSPTSVVYVQTDLWAWALKRLDQINPQQEGTA